jgi:hypothetical protein
MESYPRAAAERAMKMQEVILRAMAKKISWWQAAEIIGITDENKAETLIGWLAKIIVDAWSSGGLAAKVIDPLGMPMAK